MKPQTKKSKVCFIRPYTPEDHAGRLCGPQRLAADLLQHLPINYSAKSIIIAKTKPVSLQKDEIFLKKNKLFPIKITYLIRKIKPEIIHGHGSLNTCLVLYFLKKVSGAKAVLTFTDFKKNITNNYKILNKLDSIIVQTQFAREKLILKGVHPEKIEVILYGINPSKQKANLNHLIRSLSSKIVLYYGDARTERGFQLILDALPLIQEDIFILLCLRNVHAPFQVEKIISAIHQRKNIKLLFAPDYPGPIEDIIQSSDIVVLPFLHNTLEPPLTILEVAALGTPLITTNVGGIKEVVPAHTKILEENTAKELAHAINNYDFENSDLKPKTYSWPKAALQVKKVYEQVSDNLK